MSNHNRKMACINAEDTLIDDLMWSRKSEDMERYGRLIAALLLGKWYSKVDIERVVIQAFGERGGWLDEEQQKVKKAHSWHVNVKFDHASVSWHTLSMLNPISGIVANRAHIPHGVIEFRFTATEPAVDENLIKRLDQDISRQSQEKTAKILISSLRRLTGLSAAIGVLPPESPI